MDFYKNPSFVNELFHLIVDFSIEQVQQAPHSIPMPCTSVTTGDNRAVSSRGQSCGESSSNLISPGCTGCSQIVGNMS